MTKSPEVVQKLLANGASVRRKAQHNPTPAMDMERIIGDTLPARMKEFCYFAVQCG